MSESKSPENRFLPIETASKRFIQTGAIDARTQTAFEVVSEESPFQLVEGVNSEIREITEDTMERHGIKYVSVKLRDGRTIYVTQSSLLFGPMAVGKPLTVDGEPYFGKIPKKEVTIGGKTYLIKKGKDDYDNHDLFALSETPGNYESIKVRGRRANQESREFDIRYNSGSKLKYLHNTGSDYESIFRDRPIINLANDIRCYSDVVLESSEESGIVLEMVDIFMDGPDGKQVKVDAEYDEGIEQMGEVLGLKNLMKVENYILNGAFIEGGKEDTAGVSKIVRFEATYEGNKIADLSESFNPVGYSKGFNKLGDIHLTSTARNSLFDKKNRVLSIDNNSQKDGVISFPAIRTENDRVVFWVETDEKEHLNFKNGSLARAQIESDRFSEDDYKLVNVLSKISEDSIISTPQYKTEFEDLQYISNYYNQEEKFGTHTFKVVRKENDGDGFLVERELEGGNTVIQAKIFVEGEENSELKAIRSTKFSMKDSNGKKKKYVFNKKNDILFDADSLTKVDNDAGEWNRYEIKKADIVLDIPDLKFEHIMGYERNTKSLIVKVSEHDEENQFTILFDIESKTPLVYNFKGKDCYVSQYISGNGDSLDQMKLTEKGNVENTYLVEVKKRKKRKKS